MIGKITGRVFGHYGNVVIVDVESNSSSVGYEVIMKQADISTLQNGEQITLFIKEVIKEDDDVLYGFLSFEDRCWFEEFTKISGLGPKTALTILSTFTCDAITDAIMMNNCDFFASISGIGAKIANRIPVEMRKQVEKINEKVLNFGVFDISNIENKEDKADKKNNGALLNISEEQGDQDDKVIKKTSIKAKDGNGKNGKNHNSAFVLKEAVEALTSLGFSRQLVYEDVLKIVKNEENPTTEQVVKEFLKNKDK